MGFLQSRDERRVNGLPHSLCLVLVSFPIGSNKYDPLNWVKRQDQRTGPIIKYRRHAYIGVATRTIQSRQADNCGCDSRQMEGKPNGLRIRIPPDGKQAACLTLSNSLSRYLSGSIMFSRY